MITHVCLFEDEQYRTLLPLVYLRPVYDLRCGIATLREKVHRLYPTAVLSLHCREMLADLVRTQNPGTDVNAWPERECLLINGRLLMDETMVKALSVPRRGSLVYLTDTTVVAAHIDPEHATQLRTRQPDLLALSDFEGLPTVQVEATLVSHPWDLVDNNGRQLQLDFDRMRKIRRRTARRRPPPRGVHLIDGSNILVEEGVILKPGVVLDASDGPVFLGKGVTVQPNAVIMGPAAIGDGSLVKTGTHVYDGTSVGPVCKIGGEVEASILQGYSNKQHHGFLGHSYLGSWVNLGAGTTTSDLKNNYGNVTVFLDGAEVDTGLRFVGLFMGDHSKCAINTTFNTGTVVGISCNIFGSGFPKKHVPSFAWVDVGRTPATYSLEKAVAVARTVMARRGIELSGEEERVFRTLFEATGRERQLAGVA